MTEASLLPPSPTEQYLVLENLDLWASPSGPSLASQAAQGRYVIPTTTVAEMALLVWQLEDDYRAWLPLSRLAALAPAPTPYQSAGLDRREIEARLPQVLDYLQEAAGRANTYLWGGNIGPNYDCSGLTQAAFASAGIWLPRDSYQQEMFTRRVSRRDLQPGDLIFFGTEKVDHVGVYLGEGRYLHSSGTTMGRNGIGVDTLNPSDDPVSRAYGARYWSCGRVESSYRSRAALGDTLN
ncbi:MAG: NlpC/P60 family protein [Cyanobacteria bacterium RI_101]|nr:NlpC/P60 family protein [Cyanobacteria bacterium RI_101]